MKTQRADLRIVQLDIWEQVVSWTPSEYQIAEDKAACHDKAPLGEMYRTGGAISEGAGVRTMQGDPRLAGRQGFQKAEEEFQKALQDRDEVSRKLLSRDNSGLDVGGVPGMVAWPSGLAPSLIPDSMCRVT